MGGDEDAAARDDGRALTGVWEGHTPLHVFARGTAEIRGRLTLHNKIAGRPGGLRPVDI